MRGLSVIIPSKTGSNLNRCIPAIRTNEPSVRIIVIDDGIGPDWTEPADMVIQGAKPFCFARNCNLGINAAGADDVVLMNDDAILESPDGFRLMQWCTDAPNLGLISATTNVVGNPEQFRKKVGLLAMRPTSRPSLAFVCVLIPRRTIDDVGLMDERFGGVTEDGRVIYGFCDNDYCRRTREKQYWLGISDMCYVDHGSLTSSFRGDPYAGGDISVAADIYRQKWGDLN